LLLYRCPQWLSLSPTRKSPKHKNLTRKKSFDKMKTLGRFLDGVLSGTGSELDGKTLHVTLRVTSMVTLCCMR